MIDERITLNKIQIKEITSKHITKKEDVYNIEDLSSEISSDIENNIINKIKASDEINYEKDKKILKDIKNDIQIKNMENNDQIKYEEKIMDQSLNDNGDNNLKEISVISNKIDNIKLDIIDTYNNTEIELGQNEKMELDNNIKTNKQKPLNNDNIITNDGNRDIVEKENIGMFTL